MAVVGRFSLYHIPPYSRPNPDPSFGFANSARVPQKHLWASAKTSVGHRKRSRSHRHVAAQHAQEEQLRAHPLHSDSPTPVSYTHLRAHETLMNL
eukprot:2338283-Prymnesium_polylepis.1